VTAHPGLERVVTETRVAVTVAETARAVPGVCRLQPDVWGLLRQVAAEAWERATGTELPDIGGVQVSIEHDPARPDTAVIDVDISVVTDGRDHAATVARAVQHRVRAALAEATTTAVRTIAVHITEIELAPRGR